MSLVVGASGGGAAPERSNFFLDLPDELLEVVLGYMKPGEGFQLMGTQKVLKNRIVNIFLNNQIEYFTRLCKKISEQFLFAPEEYRQDVAEKGKEMEETSQEILCPALAPLTLTSLIEKSQLFGGKIAPFTDKRYWFGLFFRPEKYKQSFLNPLQERVQETLVRLGRELIYSIRVLSQRKAIFNHIFEFLERGEEEEEKRALYIEIAIDHPGSQKKIFDLIQTINNEKRKEQLMNIWMDPLRSNSSVLEKEEIVEKISALHLRSVLPFVSEENRLVLTLFDKTIRHPNKFLRKEVLFRFFRYCGSSKFKEPFRGELYSKFIALIETLPEAERSVGVFGVLKGMIDSHIVFSKKVRLSDFEYGAASLSYLQYQVDQEGKSPLHIMEVRAQIMKQAFEHTNFNNCFGVWIGNIACNIDRENRDLISFFQAAMERAREESEAALIVNSALKQVDWCKVGERPSLVNEILSVKPGYPPAIREMIIEKRRELIPEVVVL